MDLLGYSRVSRVAGREHLISPELQQRRIQSYADMKGWRVEMLPPELDVSGGKVKRPILEAAIDLRGAWGGMDLEQRRHVLGSFLGVVWVWGHHDFRFIARGFEPAGLSGPGRKGPKPVPLENTNLEGEIRMLGAGDVTEGTGDVA